MEKKINEMIEGLTYLRDRVRLVFLDGIHKRELYSRKDGFFDTKSVFFKDKGNFSLFLLGKGKAEEFATSDVECCLEILKLDQLFDSLSGNLKILHEPIIKIGSGIDVNGVQYVKEKTHDICYHFGFKTKENSEKIDFRYTRNANHNYSLELFPKIRLSIYSKNKKTNPKISPRDINFAYKEFQDLDNWMRGLLGSGKLV